MSTYKELIYMVSDLAKQQSDDTTLTERHIAFLLNKYRAYLLKQKYLNKAQEIPLSNYQTVCADLTLVPAFPGCTYEQCMAGDNSPLLRSVNKVELPLTFSDTKVSLFKCPGEYSIKINNTFLASEALTNPQLYTTKALSSRQYKQLVSLFSNPYLPIYPDGANTITSNSSSDWEQGVWEHYDEEDTDIFPGGYETYTAQYFADYIYPELPTSYDNLRLVSCTIRYNKKRDVYWIYDPSLTINSETTFYNYLPLSWGLYSTTCSEDAQQLLSILKKYGIDASLLAENQKYGPCNETIFYTTATRRFDNIATVDRERFNYVGLSKYYKKGGYATIGVDNHLYIKSQQDLSAYAAEGSYDSSEDSWTDGLPTGKAIITAIFENPDKAYEQSSCTYKNGDTITKCPNTSSTDACDPWDREFPIEDALQTQLISLVLKDIYGGSLRPKDGINNANDDLSSIENFVRNAMKERYTRDNGVNPQ